MGNRQGEAEKLGNLASAYLDLGEANTLLI
jgi:hypothetical protein